MPDKTPTQLIREFGVEVARLDQRVVLYQKDIDRIEGRLLDLEKRFQALDKQAALTNRDFERLEKKVEDSQARRWELGKLVLAAFLGALLTLGTGVASRLLDRFVQSGAIRPKP